MVKVTGAILKSLGLALFSWRSFFREMLLFNGEEENWSDYSIIESFMEPLPALIFVYNIPPAPAPLTFLLPPLVDLLPLLIFDFSSGDLSGAILLIIIYLAFLIVSAFSLKLSFPSWMSSAKYRSMTFAAVLT
jgi:hypothetical protein